MKAGIAARLVLCFYDIQFFRLCFFQLYHPSLKAAAENYFSAVQNVICRQGG